MRTRRSLLALTAPLLALCSSVFAQSDDVEPRQIVYLLAGQSNIRFLQDADFAAAGCPAPIPGSPQLSYSSWDGFSSALTPIQPTIALQRFGEDIRLRTPQDQVHIAMIARSGSSLLRRNVKAAVPEAWFDPSPTWLPLTICGRIGPALQNFASADELHIVWGQGESDIFCTGALFPAECQPVTALEYRDNAEIVFHILTLLCGQTGAEVHLVTPGAIEGAITGLTAVNMEELRDAYFQLDRGGAQFAFTDLSIQTVAHHYDLSHVQPNLSIDPAHLGPCEYITLAARIAEGIRFPALHTQLGNAHAVALNGSGVVLSTTLAMTPPPNSTALLPFFEVRVNGAVLTSGLTVGASGTSISINDSLNRLVPGSVSIRHIPGTGFGQMWTVNPLRSTAQTSLEPFALSL